MSRYPNLTLGDGGDFAGRPNGFRFRRIFVAPGSVTWTVPDYAPVGPDGLALVRAALVGAGQGGSSAGNGFSGAGGGYCERTMRVAPGAAAALVIGAGGTGAETGAAGAATTFTIPNPAGGNYVLSAHGGGSGTSSGGEINTNGGGGFTPSGTSMLAAGGGAGTPFENGFVGAESAPGNWRLPRLWGLSDPVAHADFWFPFDGIGKGGPSPSFGGGGAKVSTNSAEAGAGGLVIVWW